MTFYEQEKIQNMKLEKLEEQKGFCAGCNKSFVIGDKIELAHILPKRKYLIKLYGVEIINNYLNLKLTHSGDCNAAVQMSPNKTELVKDHIEMIRRAIEE